MTKMNKMNSISLTTDLRENIFSDHIFGIRLHKIWYSLFWSLQMNPTNKGLKFDYHAAENVNILLIFSSLFSCEAYLEFMCRKLLNEKFVKNCYFLNWFQLWNKRHYLIKNGLEHYDKVFFALYFLFYAKYQYFVSWQKFLWF